MFASRFKKVSSQQPSNGNVGVKYYFTDAEYSNIEDSLNHANYSAVTDLNMFKAQSNISGGGAPTPFADPHTVNGIVLSNGSTPSTTVWVVGTHGTSDHIAEFEVASFSGGGPLRSQSGDSS